MIGWTNQEMIDAAIKAPLGRDYLRDDSQVIERPGWFQIVTPSTRGAFLNKVVFSQVDEDEAEAAIDEVEATYRALVLPVQWYVGPWTEPSDFGDRLEKRGLRGAVIRAMSCKTSMPLEAGEGTIEEVTEATLDEYVAAFIQGWAFEADQTEPTRRQVAACLAASPRTAHFFVVRRGKEIAGTAGLLQRGRAGYLVGAHVFERFRGQGLYQLLIEARLRFLTQAGTTLAVTHAREATSAPILEHLGFETLFRSRCYVIEP